MPECSLVGEVDPDVPFLSTVGSNHSLYQGLLRQAEMIMIINITSGRGFTRAMYLVQGGVPQS